MWYLFLANAFQLVKAFYNNNVYNSEVFLLDYQN